MRFLLTLLISTFLILFAQAQPADSARILTLNELLDWVLTHHPVAARARLLGDQAAASERAARGAFDPKLYADWQQKTFDGKDYFSVGETGFKVPSWFGLEFKGTFSVAEGQYLNPEQRVPAAGQALLGIKASLGQGMFIDERRAALQQAQLLEQRNEAERRQRLNDLTQEATKAYWEWTVAYNQLLIYRRAIGVAGQRFDGIVESFRQGDKPAVDTLETLIQLQNWQFDLNEAALNYKNAGLALSNFLWLDGKIPVEITDARRPWRWTEADNVPVAPLQNFLEIIAQRHPELQQYQVELKQLDVDRRLAGEMLKPRLDLEYNLLGDGFNFGRGGMESTNNLTGLLLNNYKWGLQFQFPIFLRKERGKLELTRIKLVDVDYKLQQKRLELTNKVKQYYNDLQNTLEQILLYQDVVNNYQRLLDAELRKFSIGESSIFLLNSREQKLIESQLKLAKLEGEYRKVRAGLEWAAGGI